MSEDVKRDHTAHYPVERAGLDEAIAAGAWWVGSDYHGFPWGSFEVADGVVYEMVWDDDAGHNMRGPVVTDDWCDTPEHRPIGFICHDPGSGVVAHFHPCPLSLVPAPDAARWHP